MTGESDLARAIAAGPVILDGGLATLLEAHRHDLSSALWSARLLVADPDAIVAAHREYFAAGAQVAITASYQASLQGFAAIGLSRAAAEQALCRSVELARRAAREVDGPPGRRWVATSVGPYGAALADGSEYRGDYGLTVHQLREWHRPRLEILADAGGDVLAVETIPCQSEVEALLTEIQALDVPAWLSVTARRGRTRAGEPVDDVFAMAGGVDQVIAVGVNCVESVEAADLVAAARENSGKPVVVYPNSGEDWDADNRTWVGTATFGPEQAAAWAASGARLIGGCCRVGPELIRQLAQSAAGRPAMQPGSSQPGSSQPGSPR